MTERNIAIDLFNYETQQYDLQKSQKSAENKPNNLLSKTLKTVKKKKAVIQDLQDIKANFFNDELNYNFDMFRGDIETAIKWTSLDCAVLKPNSLVNYKLPYERNYNKKSLQNLINVNEDEKKQKTKSKELKKMDEIKNVNTWSNEYKKHYQKETGKNFTGLLSKQTVNKILKITSCFTRSVLSKYNPINGFNQRTLCFATFTITESQKHSDEIIIKNFIDFIDHLKKVKNYLINPITKERTKQEGLKIQNYVWRAETQENGNIHFHLISDCFLNQDMLRRVWNGYLQKMGYKYGYGAANVQSLKVDKKTKKIKSVENYLCKYMTKQPLRNKYKFFTKQQLETISDDEKYRRPIIGKSWGCSKALLSLEYPVFYQHEAKRVMREFKGKLKQIISEKIPEYIKIFKGNIKNTLKTCSYDLQKAVKSHFKVLYWHLYPKNKLIPITS